MVISFYGFVGIGHGLSFMGMYSQGALSWEHPIQFVHSNSTTITSEVF
jgi:hypothetical protein